MSSSWDAKNHLHIKGIYFGNRDESILTQKKNPISLGAQFFLPAPSVFFLSFIPLEIAHMKVFINSPPVLGTGLRSSWDKLIPPQSHVNSSKEIARYYDEFISG